MRRLAVLTTFEGDHAFTARHPDDGAKVAAALQPLRPDWAFDTWPVSHGRWPEDPGAYDGLVITGSPASVNDDSAWIRRLEDLVRERHALRQPMLGICFGHQVIAKALGGRVAASPAGLRVGTLTSQLHSPAPWMQPAPPAVTLYGAQEEHVVALPDGAVALGGEAVCPVTYYAIGRHVFATQCHPEFYPSFMHDVLDTLHEKGHLSPEAHARGRAQLAAPDDAALMRRWIVQFFEQAFVQEDR